MINSTLLEIFFPKYTLCNILMHEKNTTIAWGYHKDVIIIIRASLVITICNCCPRNPVLALVKVKHFHIFLHGFLLKIKKKLRVITVLIHIQECGNVEEARNIQWERHRLSMNMRIKWACIYIKPQPPHCVRLNDSPLRKK